MFPSRIWSSVVAGFERTAEICVFAYCKRSKTRRMGTESSALLRELEFVFTLSMRLNFSMSSAEVSQLFNFLGRVALVAGGISGVGLMIAKV